MATLCATDPDDDFVDSACDVAKYGMVPYVVWLKAPDVEGTVNAPRLPLAHYSCASYLQVSL